MARVFAMAANKTDQVTQQNQSRNQFEPHSRTEFQEVGLFIILMDLKDHTGENLMDPKDHTEENLMDHTGENNIIQGTTINNLKT